MHGAKHVHLDKRRQDINHTLSYLKPKQTFQIDAKNPGVIIKG
jgi:hypothetical protein